MNPMMLINEDPNFELRNEVTEMKRDLDKLKREFKNELGCCFEFRNCLSFVTIMYILIVIFIMRDLVLEDHKTLYDLLDRTKNVYNNTNNINYTHV
jgi:hypothetical protein